MRHQVTALALTIAFEAAGMLAFSLAVPSQRRRIPANLAAVAALNAVTHTIFWNIFPLVAAGGCPYIVKLITAECLVSIIEGAVYRMACKMRTSTAMALALGLNALSWLAGGAVLGMIPE